jgi:hypothetical protein
VIRCGESSDYNPRDDGVMEEEEVVDSVMEMNVKVQTFTLFGGVGLLVCFLLYCFSFILCSHNNILVISCCSPCCLYKTQRVSRKKKSAVRKVSNNKKSPDASSTMAPGRVMAVPPGASMRMLEVDEPAPPASPRVTRKKAKETVVPTHEENPLHNDHGGSLQMDDDVSMDEGSSARLDLCPMDRNADFPEDPEQAMGDEGKFMSYCFLFCIFYYSCIFLFVRSI